MELKESLVPLESKDGGAATSRPKVKTLQDIIREEEEKPSDWALKMIAIKKGKQ